MTILFIATCTIVAAALQGISAINFTECGVSKGCFRKPDNCSSVQTCTYAVTYASEDGQVRFEMAAPFDATFGFTVYVALGLAETQSMAAAMVVACTNTGITTNVDTFRVARTHTEGHDLFDEDLEDLPEGYLQLVSNEYLSDVISCEFTMNATKPENVGFAKGLNQNLYLLLAKGDVYDDGKLVKHSERAVSNSTISLLVPELDTKI